jgi:penicillin-binding protein 2
MLNDDDHIPLLNKAMRGLYPPGSTMKPMATLALQLHGVDPAERVSCPGGYRLGSRFFRCDAVHGSVDMRSAIEHSCNTYFWSMAHRIGYDAIAPVAKMLGLGQEFDLPVTGQRYGTIPDAAWKMRRFHQEWSTADSLNASIGQGYVSVSPLQLAIMTARIATGRNLNPSLLLHKPMPLGPALPFTPEQLAVPHDGMFRVVNGSGRRRAALCHALRGRARRLRLQRRRADRQGRDDLPVRPRQGLGHTARAREGLGRDADRAHGRQVRELRPAVRHHRAQAR